MRRSEKVEATLTAEEKEILQRLCDEAGCTEAELIRSVLISRSISLDDLETKKIERVKNKTLQKQGRKHAPEKTDERGEAIAEKRDVSFHVMLTAPEKRRSNSAQRRSAFLQANWFAAAQFTERSNHSILTSRKLKNSIMSY